MLRLTSAWLAVSSCLTSAALAVHLHGRDINEPLLESYDYIVVGCGISGLVVSNRLSEIDSRTVLCIEAGDADHYEAIIQDPVYVGADIGGIYDWDLETVPQTQLDGNTRPMPQGKVLGGGSILNAMCWNRGGSDDFDAWEAFGNPTWGWSGMLPYFIKSETYTPVYSDEIAEEYSIHYNPTVHGTAGPVQVSYPKYFYPQSINLFAGMNILGLPTQFDPNDGTSAGPAFVPTDLDPNNQTRSDARRTYFDPYVTRSNFHVITGQHVTRVLIEGTGEVDNPIAGGDDNGNGPASGNNEGFGFGPGGSTPPLSGQTPPRFARRQDPGTSNLRVSGVEFAPNASAPRQTVYATREVIVAAGALHSAQLLQLSGIGPASLLNQYNITVALNLPGVGNNLQDHPLVGTFYPYNNASYPSPTELTTNATYNLEAEQEYDTDKTGPWTAGSPNGLAFNPLPLISNNSASILSNASNQSPTDYLISGLDPTVIAGFTAQKQSLVARLAENTVAAYEIINNNAGSLTVSIMHPFSRGTCYIQSADPFQPPAIDPRWLTNPVDRQVLIEALLFNRKILATPPMVELQPAQFVPPVDADEDALNQVINNGIRTEFHPSGTLAMLPLEQGGVVNSHLLVWGTQNLRVVDAGIFPIIPAAHLQAVVYGVAEKAADIIKADNLSSSAVPTPSSPSTALSTVQATSLGVAVATSAAPTSSSTTATSSTALVISSGVAASSSASPASPSSTMAGPTILATSSVPVTPSSSSPVQSVITSAAESSITSPTPSTILSTDSSIMDTSATSLDTSAVFSVVTSTTSLSAIVSPSSTLQPALSSTAVLASSLSPSLPATFPQSSVDVSIVNSQPSFSQTSTVLASTTETSSIFITTSSGAASEPSSSSSSTTSPTQTGSSSGTTPTGTSTGLPLAGPAQSSTASTLPSSPESVVTFTTTSASSLPNSTPSVATTGTTTSPSTTDQSTPAFSPTTSPGPEELSTSVVGVLTSAGVPSSVASSLAPIIIGSPPETIGIPSASSTATETEQQQAQAAIVTFIQWFLSFFHLT